MSNMTDYKNIHSFTINLGKNIGGWRVYYDFNADESNNEKIPCRLVIKWGSQILDTGFLGNSNYNKELNDLGFSSVLSDKNTGYLTIDKDNQDPVNAEVTLYTPIKESLSKVSLYCIPEIDSAIEPGSDTGIKIFWDSNNFDNIIILYMPSYDYQNIEGEIKSKIYVNDKLKTVINYNKYLLYENQSNVKNPGTGSSAYSIWMSGGFTLYTRESLDLVMSFWGNFSEGKINFYYDPFNQNFNINENNIYNFYRDYDSSSLSHHKNWGLLRCLMPTGLENWGTEKDF